MESRAWFYFHWKSPAAHVYILLSSNFCFYYLKDFLKFRVIYKSDTKQVELVATNIKKELNKDSLI